MLFIFLSEEHLSGRGIFSWMASFSGISPQLAGGDEQEARLRTHQFMFHIQRFMVLFLHDLGVDDENEINCALCEPLFVLRGTLCLDAVTDFFGSSGRL